MSHFVQRSKEEAKGLLSQFRHQFRIDDTLDPLVQLRLIATSFAQLPYENLTKILREHQTRQADDLRRLPSEILSEHTRLGTGGTCFSLTWTLLHLVRALGLRAEPILADRRYGPDTHSALLVWMDGRKLLLDPGYLLVDAVPMPEQNTLLVPTSFHEVQLEAQQQGERLSLSTIHQQKSTYRLTYKTKPVDTAEFLRAWDASFNFDMMGYPVLSRIVEGKLYYLQKQSLLVRSRETSERVEVATDNMVETIHQVFGIDAAVASQSLQALRR